MGHQQTIHFWTNHDRFPKLCVGGTGLSKACVLIIILTKGIYLIFNTWSQAPHDKVDVTERWWVCILFHYPCAYVYGETVHTAIWSHCAVMQQFFRSLSSDSPFTLILCLVCTKKDKWRESNACFLSISSQYHRSIFISVSVIDQFASMKWDRTALEHPQKGWRELFLLFLPFHLHSILAYVLKEESKMVIKPGCIQALQSCKVIWSNPYIDSINPVCLPPHNSK